MSAEREVYAIRKASGVASTRVPGHDLWGEGGPQRCAKPVDGCIDMSTGWPKSDGGHGRCSCGALSEPLPSNNQRKSWHRQHKLDVLAERAR